MMFRPACLSALYIVALAGPAAAETLLCAPVAVAEIIGEPGPLTISASNPELGNPTIFWVDTRTGAYLEHFDGGVRFISRKGTLEVDEGAKPSRFVGLDREEGELTEIDLRYRVRPFHRSVGGALTQIGTCAPAPLGQLPTDPLGAPTSPFPYTGKVKP